MKKTCIEFVVEMRPTINVTLEITMEKLKTDQDRKKDLKTLNAVLLKKKGEDKPKK